MTRQSVDDKLRSIMIVKTELMTTGEAAEFLSVASGTLRNWRLRSVGPAYVKMTGGTVRYDRGELVDFLRRKQQGGESPTPVLSSPHQGERKVGA